MPGPRLQTRLNATILIIAIVILGQFAIGLVGFNVLSAVRAYVGGEGLWAKNQKESCYELQRYLHTGNPARYQAFLEKLQVPLGDKQARLELDRPNSDDAVITEGFLDGGNHPEDVPGMITLYKVFASNIHIGRAIEQWQSGDLLIAELLEVGEAIDAHVTSGTNDASSVEGFVAEIDRLQDELTQVENLFSFHMGEASRWAVNLLLSVMVGFSLIGGLVCLTMMFLVVGLVSRLRKYSQELETTTEIERKLKLELMGEKEKLEGALAEIKTLRGILPICSFCKKIRDDEGIWSQLEKYIHEHSGAEFSHGICPNCMTKHYPDI